LMSDFGPPFVPPTSIAMANYLVKAERAALTALPTPNPAVTPSS
jgi:hypothetical protein